MINSEKYEYINKDENILLKYNSTDCQGELTVPIGRRENGSIFYLDLSDVPHMMITGYTGTGKTSFVQTLLMCLIYKYSTSNVRFIIFDTKQVDYHVFEMCQHMIMPILKDRSQLDNLLPGLENEIIKRCNILVENNVKDIKSFNQKYCEKKLEHIYVIMDDFLSLNLDKQVINRIANIMIKGRVTGVHFILITSLMANAKSKFQEILAQVTVRVTFRVSSHEEAKNVIEISGAEKLMVPGELILKQRGNEIRCKSVYTTSDEIEKTIRALNANPIMVMRGLTKDAVKLFESSKENDVDDILNKILNSSSLSQKGSDISNEEIVKAAIAIINSNKASIGMLQRELKIGFNKAASIMDRLCDMHVVSEEQGSVPRRILMTLDEWKRYCVSHGWTMYDKKEDEKARKVLKTENEVLKDYPNIYLKGSTLGIKNEEIIISKTVMTQKGIGRSTFRFSKVQLKEIIYSKPRLFKDGCVKFVLNDEIRVVNNNENLINFSRNEVLSFLRIDFKQEEEEQVRLFLKHVSEGTGIVVNYVR